MRVPLSQYAPFSSLITERETIKAKARIQELHFTKPSFIPLAKTIVTGEKLSPKDLVTYKKYYEEAVKILPHVAEIHAILGFCYYHADKFDQAIAAFQKAIQLNPNFYWSYYNLGAIYFKEKDYAKVREVLATGILVRSDVTLKVVQTSQVFRQIFLPSNNFYGYHLEESLRQGQAKGLMLLILSAYYRKNFSAMFDYSSVAVRSHPRLEFIYCAGLAAHHLNKIKDFEILVREYLRKNRDTASVDISHIEEKRQENRMVEAMLKKDIYLEREKSGLSIEFNEFALNIF